MTLDNKANIFIVYVVEYTGLEAIDDQHFQIGTVTTANGATSGPVHTTVDGDLIFGFGTSNTLDAGTGFMERSVFKQNLIEDRVALEAGTYEAIATATGPWTMLAAAFKPER